MIASAATTTIDIICNVRMNLGTPKATVPGRCGFAGRRAFCHMDTVFAVTHNILAGFPARLQRAFISPSSVTLYLVVSRSAAR
jgi:hypothetical protein